jgi:hypothetical protein
MSHSNTLLLDRLLDPVSRCLTPEVAQKLVQLCADAVAVDRMEELAGRCNEGLLSAAEREEYEALVVANQFIALLQARARRFLRWLVQKA